MGITVEPFTEQTRGASTVPVRRGAIITAIKPGSPAANADLPLGAVIVAIDGKRVDSSEDLVSAIRAVRPGQEVELTYYEGDRLSRKPIRLVAASGQAASSPGPSAGPTAPGSSAPSGRGGSFGIPPGSGYGSAPPVDAPPRTAPSGPGLPGGATNRPLLQRIERMADTLTRPTGTTTVYDPLAMAALQTRVVEMAEQIRTLEDRLKALESKLGIATPAAPALTPGLGAAPSGTGTNP